MSYKVFYDHIRVYVFQEIFKSCLDFEEEPSYTGKKFKTIQVKYYQITLVYNSQRSLS